ncbi:CvpA family protein [Halieaceae bacterium IMCC14734]|uniref:CvpA family protein n=1 Tax=Candidatus Litorirhabdus singularis TaxID=2518993 RepID=A0ABT3TH71_9GAMM|nr:CvpA family protein [Candidatus Litorirhabdus singularis]MCX2981668.1 CvpA family protein [Candidatus Litorirhabdus singularis]
MDFHWIDWLIMGVIGLSIFFSLLRGFVKEALSLVAWVVAFVLSTTFAPRLAALLEEVIAADALRYAVAYVLLFLATLILGAFINRLLSRVIQMTGLTLMDRLLGMVFGFARGVLIVTVAVLVLRGLAPSQTLEQESKLLPHVLLVAQWAQDNFSTLLGDYKLPVRV